MKVGRKVFSKRIAPIGALTPFGAEVQKMACDQICPQEKGTGKENKNVLKCRHCKSEKMTKKGLRQTRKRGKIQRYLCQDCKRSSCADEGFWRMRNSEKNITLAVDMYLSNLSSRKMRNQLKRHMETKISHVAILDWVRRYVLKVHKYTETLKPSLGGHYYMDETEIDCEGRNDFLWVAVDWETRFIPNTHYSLFSDVNNCTQFLKKIKEKNLPKYIQTDSAVYYESAFRKSFSEGEIEHHMNNVSKTGKHNVRIETVFSKLKDRIDDFRGLKAKWSAPIILQGLVLQHNFIEEHTTTGQRPCELAGIKIVHHDNVWLSLIQQAAASQ